MIDIHCHPLPGIDDGADDLATAVAMCRAAAADGCTALIATPHQRHHAWPNLDSTHLRELTEGLRDAIGDTLDVRLGAEIRVDEDLVSDLVQWPETSIQPLAGSRYLLLEYDRSGIGPNPEQFIKELVTRGWRPILAHPEFIPRLGDDLSLLERLVDMGAMLQLTAMSVLGEFGQRAHELSHRILDYDLAHFVASDAHGVDWRPPGLSAAFASIAERWGEAVAARLMQDNPGAVLADRPIAAPSPTPSG
jgi:protein-tyrosine phosphatase